MIHSLPIHSLFQREFFHLESMLWKDLACLVKLFQSIFSSTPSHSTPSLLHHHFTIGGVENGGNTCILSVLLQEMAALPHFYDATLTATVKQQANESEEHLALRRNLQLLLKSSVDAIRSGKTVERNKVHQLSGLFLQLGWLQDVAPFWRLKLHQWAPTLFSLPLSDPNDLYEQLAALYPEAEDESTSIALLARTSSIAHRQLFGHSPFLNASQDVLWRVAENTPSHTIEDSFQIDQRLFTLKAVHTYEDKPQGRHVLIYRKEGEDWFCCNDHTIYPVSSLPTTNIYTSVYESCILSDQP